MTEIADKKKRNQQKKKTSIQINFILFRYRFIESEPGYGWANVFVCPRLNGRAGELMSPINVQSASRIVKSFSEPKNRDDNSKSLIFSRTTAPRT